MMNYSNLLHAHFLVFTVYKWALMRKIIFPCVYPRQRKNHETPRKGKSFSMIIEDELKFRCY